MPRTNPNLTPDARKELILRALRGESKKKLAEEYGVARSWVYKLEEDTKEKFRKELDFWAEVAWTLEYHLEG